MRSVGKRNGRAADADWILDFFFDDDFEVGVDAVDQPYGDEGFAEDFDRLVEGDAALVDLETLRGEALGQVGGRD